MSVPSLARVRAFAVAGPSLLAIAVALSACFEQHQASPEEQRSGTETSLAERAQSLLDRMAGGPARVEHEERDATPANEVRPVQPIPAPAATTTELRMPAGQTYVRAEVADGMPAPRRVVDTETYRDVDANPVHLTAETPVSTFSIDVDTAAYANVRRFLEDGVLPPTDAVRIEEMVNYFDYAYALPEDGAGRFSADIVVMPTPWNPGTELLRIGIQGYDIPLEARPRANLVFLADVSGSMQDSDKLPLLRQALRQLVDTLEDDDTVAIVTYAGEAGVVLDPTAGRERGKILAAIDAFRAGGSTAGGEGIRQAYALARMNFDDDAVNRVILATDGDFNVGIADPRRLEDFVARQRDSGVYLSVLGFGAGNLNDAMMQTLAQAGNGNAAYIDSRTEARKVLVDEMSSTLFPIADDVKIQVEFNPAQVAEYRLIGYETRMLNREDFNNDAVDAGEIGSGHSVTALYELTPPDSDARLIDPLRYGGTNAAEAPESQEIAFLRIRYKMPGEDESQLIALPIDSRHVAASVEEAPGEARFAAAVAAFGQTLRGDAYVQGFGYDAIADLARGAVGEDAFGYRAEFLRLVRLAGTATAQAPLN